MMEVSPRPPTPGCRCRQLPVHTEPLRHPLWTPLSRRSAVGAQEVVGLGQGAPWLCSQGQPCSRMAGLTGQASDNDSERWCRTSQFTDSLTPLLWWDPHSQRLGSGDSQPPFRRGRHWVPESASPRFLTPLSGPRPSWVLLKWSEKEGAAQLWRWCPAEVEGSLRLERTFPDNDSSLPMCVGGFVQNLRS